MSLTKRVLKQRLFPEDEGYRYEGLVSSRSKKNRYLTKLEKVIKTVTKLIESIVRWPVRAANSKLLDKQ